jgi:hypothetical protein
MGSTTNPVLLAAVLAIASVTTLAQGPSLTGRWVASRADRGVVVALDLGTVGKLTIPGTGPSGRVEALSLAIRDVKRAGPVATFSVDLPDGEGAILFDFTVEPNGEFGRIVARRIEGEPGDDLPSWRLARAH